MALGLRLESPFTHRGREVCIRHQIEVRGQYPSTKRSFPVKFGAFGTARVFLHEQAEVAELADALRSGRSDPCGHVGSNPTFGTKMSPRYHTGGSLFVEDPGQPEAMLPRPRQPFCTSRSPCRA